MIIKQKYITYYIIISLAIIYYILFENIVQKPIFKQSYPDQCMSCHANTTNIDNSHPNEIFGCFKCQWGEIKLPKGHTAIDDIKGKADNNISLAEDHFRKACASCHINQDESVFDDQNHSKGGGCVDCHRITKTIIHENNSTLKIQHSTLVRELGTQC